VQHHGGVDGYVRSIVRVSAFAQYLRYAGYVAAIVWALTFVGSFWLASDQATSFQGFMGPAEQETPWAAIVLWVMRDTWGYLITAVVAFALSGVLEGRLVDELGDEDDGGGDDGGSDTPDA
jgi:hypothetical protein